MSRYRQVGCYRELEGSSADDDATALSTLVRGAPQPDEDRILAYLKQGIVAAAAGDYVGDVLDPTVPRSIPLEVRTDGVYIWRSDYAYYITKYHIPVPEDFVQHMRTSGWRVTGDEETILADW